MRPSQTFNKILEEFVAAKPAEKCATTGA